MAKTIAEHYTEDPDSIFRDVFIWYRCEHFMCGHLLHFLIDCLDATYIGVREVQSILSLPMLLSVAAD